MSDEVDDLLDILDSEDEASNIFTSALAKLEKFAYDGNADAAEAIAEIFAFSTRHRDAAKAYCWYHVSLGSQGHLTAFENLHQTVDQYSGPAGDFRNEAQVSGLLAELGEFRVRQLDGQAAEWFRKHRAG